VLDSFNRANGGLGTNWSGAISGYSVSSNQNLVGAGGDIYWRSTAFGANQEVYVTLSTIRTNSTELDLILKAQSSTSYSGGLIEVWYSPASNRVQIWTYASGQGWVQRGADLAVTFAAGDRFGAQALSNGQVRVYKNGTLLGTRDVTGWTHTASGGYVGMWMLGANTTRLDDFGGGTLP
jgi:hypothetical protein